MTRADRLGLTDADYWLQSSLRDVENALAGEGYGPPDNVYGQASQVMDYSAFALIGQVLEDDTEGARNSARMCVDWTLEYFFGEWRTVPQRTLSVQGERELRQFLDYRPQYLRALSLSAILRDWSAARKLSEYPNVELCEPPVAQPTEERSYVYLLSSFLLADFHLSTNNKELLFIQSRRSKQYKLLADLGIHVSCHSRDSFNRTLDEYLRFYKARLFRQTIPQMQCLDGSFWIHCAQQVGLGPEWDHEYDDYLAGR